MTGVNTLSPRCNRGGNKAQESFPKPCPRDGETSLLGRGGCVSLVPKPQVPRRAGIGRLGS